MKVGRVVEHALTKLVEQKVTELYGDRYYPKGDKIMWKPKTYPYDKEVGHWFVLNGNLYFFVEEQDSGS